MMTISLSLSHAENQKIVDFKHLCKQIVVDNVLVRKKGILRSNVITEDELVYYYKRATNDTNMVDSTAFYEFTDSLLTRNLKVEE